MAETAVETAAEAQITETAVETAAEAQIMEMMKNRTEKKQYGRV